MSDASIKHIKISTLYIIFVEIDSIGAESMDESVQELSEITEMEEEDD